VTKPIPIDLRNLTQEKLDLTLKVRAEAHAKHENSCKYSAPCIIGTLIPDDAKIDPIYDFNTVARMLAEGRFEAPEDQHDTMIKLQHMFDTALYTEDQIRQLATPWITT